MITIVILIMAGLAVLVQINSSGIKLLEHLKDQEQERALVHEDEGSGLSFEDFLDRAVFSVVRLSCPSR